MIKLKLSFGKDSQDKTLEIVDKMPLSSAVEEATRGIPTESGDLKKTFNVVVNGHIIDPSLWENVRLVSKDDVLISPRIQSGESGQLFKQALLIVVTISTYALLGPLAGTVGGALVVAGVTLLSAAALNSLIPPPALDMGNLDGLGGDVDKSQMYAITGQSNQLKRFGVVPKVYGVHRIFPPLAANPYIELAVDPTTGEMIQYLVAIYDFGLGNPVVSEIKIGDTPLTIELFEDFQYNFVDPNRPDTPVDEFDQPLLQDFQLYKGDRDPAPLSLALIDGSEFVRNTAENPKDLQTEIIVDLVCPRGLYGFSSGGEIGERTISMNLDFAPVGSSDWKSYNDLSAVDGYKVTGGTDYTDFSVNPVALVPTHTLMNDYYSQPLGVYGSNRIYTPSINLVAQRPTFVAQVYLKLNSNKLLMPKPGVNDNWQWNVGTRVFSGGSSRRLLGIINGITDLAPTYPDWVEISLDRNMTDKFDLFAYSWKGTGAFNFSGPPFSYEASPLQSMQFTASRHSAGAATVVGESTQPVYATFRFSPKIPDQYKVRLRRVSTSGEFAIPVDAEEVRIADDITWVSLTTAFNQTPIRTTLRHTFMELKIRGTNQLNGQVQNLSAVVSQPLDVYDPDTEVWSRQITSNPAWVLCDLLTNEVNKKAVDKSRLHLDSILAWQEYCDEIPEAPPGHDVNGPRFETNFILDFDTTLQGVIQQATSAAQASLNIIDGKYGVLVDRLKTTPVQIFTPRNSREFSSARFYPPRPHALKVSYIDPQLAWEISECVVYDNGYDAETATEFEEISSFACTNFEQAWRFGRYMIAQSHLRQETISIQVDFENLVCTRGDYVQISQDVMQVGGRPARIKTVAGNIVTIDDGLDIDPDIDYGYTYRSKHGEINTDTCTPAGPRTFELDGDIPEVGDLIVIGEVGNILIDCIVKSISPSDDLSAQITLVERANEIFDYESESFIPEYDPQISQTSNPNSKSPQAVTDLVLQENTYECAQTQSGYNYYATIGWETPPGSVYEFFEIWLNDSRGYRAVATTANKYFKQSLNQTFLGKLHGIKVVAVAASGKKLELVSMPEVTFTPLAKTTPPSNVEGFGISITNQVLQLSWPSITDCDVSSYELRYSPETNDIWEASVPLQIVDRNVNSISVQARTGIYFIKALDFAGNKSAESSEVITTIPDLFDLNIIETFNDAPGFDGTKEQAELLGSAVILSERVFGDVNTMEFYSEGFYVVEDILDLGEIYSVRLQSLIRADGYRYGELMGLWDHLADVDHLGTADSDDWDIVAEYRSTPEILAMADWVHLADVEHLNEGIEQGFTAWRPIPTIGDATGRVFQFRVHLKSLTLNVTPRLFDATIKVDVTDRTETFENLVSDDTDPYAVTYSKPFMGPDTSPNIQISIDGASSGDYWEITDKTLIGFSIKFYDSGDNQVSRTFDVLAQGFGSRHTVTI